MYIFYIEHSLTNMLDFKYSTEGNDFKCNP